MVQRGPLRPSHRDPARPQPEVCDVTGFVVDGSSLLYSDVEGLRGARVSAATPFLARARTAPSYEDRRRLSQVTSIIGQSRVYDPGDEKWFGAEYPQEWATPQELAGLVAWWRNDDIPYTPTVERWVPPGGLGLATASQATASLRPDVESNPFATGYRGVELAGAERLDFADLALAGAFTLALGLRTTAALATISLLAHPTGLGRLRLVADGSLALRNDAGTSATVAAVASLATDSSYVLVLTRSPAGDVTVRVNGTAGGAVAMAGALTFGRLGDAAGASLVTLAEVHAHDQDHAAAAGLAGLERVLARYVGAAL